MTAIRTPPTVTTKFLTNSPLRRLRFHNERNIVICIRIASHYATHGIAIAIDSGHDISSMNGVFTYCSHTMQTVTNTRHELNWTIHNTIAFFEYKCNLLRVLLFVRNSAEEHQPKNYTSTRWILIHIRRNISPNCAITLELNWYGREWWVYGL